MSNYEFIIGKKIKKIGNYKLHTGNPGLLRSDSVLKAIGKCINIRVSGIKSSSIPLIVLGNTPITKSYIDKVDYLKNAGVIQGFWSLNPDPIETEYIKESPEKGFITLKNEKEILSHCKLMLDERSHYFSSMLPKNQLGKIISISSKEKTDLSRAEKFLQLIQK